MNIDVLFITGFGPIVKDHRSSQALYEQTLGIEFEETGGDYLHTQTVEGVKHFGLWPLEQAAESCFGSGKWPSNIPEPQAWMEFEVADVAQASKVLEEQGYKLLVKNRTEPWGQTVTRFLSPEGILTGVVYTPQMH